MLAGTLLGGLAGTLFGLLIVRRRGVYFAMCTIAFGQLWYYLAYSWNDFTGGFDGLRDFHREPIGFGALTFDIAEGGTRFYFFLLAVFAYREPLDSARLVAFGFIWTALLIFGVYTARHTRLPAGRIRA